MTQFSVNQSAGQFFQCVAVSTTSDATGSYRRFAYTLHGLQRLPEGRRVARRLLPHLQHVQRRRHGLPGRAVCALDRNQMITAAGTPGAIQCFQLSHHVRRAAAVGPRRRDPAAGRLAELHGGLRRRGQQRPEPLEVPRGLDQLGQLHPHRPDQDHDRGLLAGLRRRHLHPAAGHDAAARLARRPPDVPPGLPQLRLLRVAGGEPLGDRRDDGLGRALVRGAQPGRHAHRSSSRARSRPTRPSRWMGSIAQDQQGNMLLGYSASSSTVRPGDPLHRSPGERRPGHDAGRDTSCQRASGRRRAASAAGATTAR